MYEDIMMRLQNGYTTMSEVIAQYGQEVFDAINSIL